jgi:hypothetical protein
MGFVDALYGRRNVHAGHEHVHAHKHGHDHATPDKETMDKIAATGAVVSPECDTDCSPTH